MCQVARRGAHTQQTCPNKAARLQWRKRGAHSRTLYLDNLQDMPSSHGCGHVGSHDPRVGLESGMGMLQAIDGPCSPPILCLALSHALRWDVNKLLRGRLPGTWRTAMQLRRSLPWTVCYNALLR